MRFKKTVKGVVASVIAAALVVITPLAASASEQNPSDDWVKVDTTVDACKMIEDVLKTDDMDLTVPDECVHISDKIFPEVDFSESHGLYTQFAVAAGKYIGTNTVSGSGTASLSEAYGGMIPVCYSNTEITKTGLPWGVRQTLPQDPLVKSNELFPEWTQCTLDKIPALVLFSDLFVPVSGNLNGYPRVPLFQTNPSQLRTFLTPDGVTYLWRDASGYMQSMVYMSKTIVLGFKGQFANPDIADRWCDVSAVRGSTDAIFSSALKQCRDNNISVLTDGAVTTFTSTQALGCNVRTCKYATSASGIELSTTSTTKYIAKPFNAASSTPCFNSNGGQYGFKYSSCGRSFGSSTSYAFQWVRWTGCEAENGFEDALANPARACTYYASEFAPNSTAVPKPVTTASSSRLAWTMVVPSSTSIGGPIVMQPRQPGIDEQAIIDAGGCIDLLCPGNEWLGNFPEFTDPQCDWAATGLGCIGEYIAAVFTWLFDFFAWLVQLIFPPNLDLFAWMEAVWGGFTNSDPYFYTTGFVGASTNALSDVGQCRAIDFTLSGQNTPMDFCREAGRFAVFTNLMAVAIYISGVFIAIRVVYKMFAPETSVSKAISPASAGGERAR